MNSVELTLPSEWEGQVKTGHICLQCQPVHTGQAAELYYSLLSCINFISLSQELCETLVLLSKPQELTLVLSRNTEGAYLQGVDWIGNQQQLLNDYLATC